MQIIQDTREQIPLNFSAFAEEIDKIQVVKLENGDYSLAGYENDIYIERKRSTGELSTNFGVDKERFNNALARTKTAKWRYIICEFTLDDILSFPENSGIPKRVWPKLRFTGKALYSFVKNVEKTHDIRFIFCENAEQAAEEVIKILRMVSTHNSVDF